MSYFSKAHRLRATTAVPNILAFAKEHGLKLTDDEAKNAKDCHGPNKQRPVYPELEGKEPNWLKKPEDSLYAAHLDELKNDAPKLVMLESLINQLGEDIYGRPERLAISTSSPVVSLIVYLVWLPSSSTVCSNTKKLAVALIQISF